MPELSPHQFMKQFHPGEYSHKWRSVASNREFLKGQPIGDLIDDVDTNGVTSPVTVFDDTVVDGHHRVIAAAVSQKSIPYEVTNDDRYTDQVDLARSARINGRQGMMPSSAPMDRRSVPPRLRSFLGWKS